MNQLVVVHGIFNYVRSATVESAAAVRASSCRKKLAKGMIRAGLAQEAPELAVAYYADLLRPLLSEESQSTDAELDFEHLSPELRDEAAQWLSAAGAPAPRELQNVGMAPLRQMLGWIVHDRGGPLGQRVRELTVRRLERVMVALLREVEAYTSWSGRRNEVRRRVADVLSCEQPKVVVAHSLGSVVAYETLHAFPHLRVSQLVTIGSPLRLPSISRRLEPGLRDGHGRRPPGVSHWTNISDLGDLVAIPPRLGGVFPVDQDETCDTGLGFHGIGGYLSHGLVASAIVPYLS